MKKTYLFILIVGVLFFLYLFFNSINNTPSIIVERLLKKGSLEGKILKFSPKYLGIIPFGEAVFEDKGEIFFRGKRLHFLEASAKTPKLLSRLFKAEAEVKSFIDPVKLYPLFFIRHLRISNHPEENKEIMYDQENNIMESEGTKRIILPHTHDPLSAIFYIRKQNFKIGKTFDINLNTNQKNYSIKAIILRKEGFSIEGKKFGVWILKAEVKRRDATPMHMHSSSFTIWFLDNPSKTPVLIKAMTGIGLVSCSLVKIE